MYSYLVTGGSAKGTFPAPLEDEKIEKFVTFTPNLIPKLLNTLCFFSETSKFGTQPPKNAFFRA